MHDALFARQEMVERLDTMAMLLEQAATEAVDGAQLELATDLWVASARVLAAADELWRPAMDGPALPSRPTGVDDA
jgi:hypothetical protein